MKYKFVFLLFVLFFILLCFRFFSHQERKLEPEDLFILPTKTMVRATPIPTTNPSKPVYTCESMTELVGFQICSAETGYDYITGPKSMKVENVSSYTVSPNKNWLFVVTYSDEYVLSGGAPAENALVMVDVNNLKAHELFSIIYFPNFTADSWSPDGQGIVLTAGHFTLSGKEYGENPYAVLYCTTSCKIIAENAGPIGIGAEPAYFDNGRVHYIGENDEEILINVQ